MTNNEEEFKISKIEERTDKFLAINYIRNVNPKLIYLNNNIEECLICFNKLDKNVVNILNKYCDCFDNAIMCEGCFIKWIIECNKCIICRKNFFEELNNRFRFYKFRERILLVRLLDRIKKKKTITRFKTEIPYNVIDESIIMQSITSSVPVFPMPPMTPSISPPMTPPILPSIAPDTPNTMVNSLSNEILPLNSDNGIPSPRTPTISPPQTPPETPPQTPPYRGVDNPDILQNVLPPPMRPQCENRAYVALNINNSSLQEYTIIADGANSDNNSVSSVNSNLDRIITGMFCNVCKYPMCVIPFFASIMLLGSYIILEHTI